MKVYIKYMVSIRCKMMVKEVLQKMGLHFIVVGLGEVDIMENLTSGQRKQLGIALQEIGLELIDDKKVILIEKIKSVIIEMVHYSEEVIKSNFSDYLSEKLHHDYKYLANLFSEVEGITIEHFIISHKVERIKELLIYGDLNISEIAWKMNYSSVAHLSKQFNKVTGFSPSHFKQFKDKRRIAIEEIGNSKWQEFSTSNESEIPKSQFERSLVEASLDPLIVTDIQGRIVDVNKAMTDLIGIDRDNHLGLDFFDFFTEPSKVKEIHKDIITKGSVLDYPLTIKHQKLTDVLFNGSAYKDDDGNVLGAVVVVKNLTEIKEAESRFSNFLETIPDAIVIANKEGKILIVNTETIKLFGYTKEELIGKEVELLIPARFKRIHPSHRENFMDKNETRPMGKHGLNLLGLTKDGKEFPVVINLSQFVTSEGILVTASIRDNTEQKKIENNLLDYKHFFNEVTDFVCVANMKGYFEQVNNTFINELGYNNSELLQNEFLTFVHPDDIEATRREIKNLKENRAIISFLNRYRKKDGSYLWFDWKANYYPDSGKIYAIARDVTNFKRIEAELLAANTLAEIAKKNAEIEKSNAENSAKAKQQFLSNMSHEIRTPLNAIIGFTKVMLKTDLSTKQKEYLNSIKTSGDTLIVLVNDVLDLAKIESGKMTFEQIPFKLESSISTMIQLFEPKIQEKNLKIVKDYDSNIPEVLLGDPIRLHQIIINLLSNAVKFTSKGNITVGVNLVSEDVEKATIKISISDTGIGIHENKFERIFENFQQASVSTSRLYGGTGLGLAIVKKLVELQGGSLQLTSKVNEGSTFSFILSFQKTTEKAISDNEILEQVYEQKSIKILVVEDVILNQLLMKTLLDDFGFEWDIADNGKVAIEKMSKQTYDLILMDLLMPEMNGFEATENIRKTLKSTIPIIALTADVTKVDMEKCMAVGMNDYISKPVDDKILYRKILEQLQKPLPESDSEEIIRKEEGKMKYINLNSLEKRTKSNPKLMMEMIAIYLEQTPILISTLKQSMLNKDWDTLYATTHKMIPSFAIVGLHTDYENIAKKIQEFARTQKQTEGILDLALQLESVCNKACKELEEEFNKLKNSTNGQPKN